MYLGTLSLPSTEIFYHTAQIWLFFIGLGWLVFKSYQWIKDIRTTDLLGLKLEVGVLKADVGTLHAATVDQTEKIESGFSSLQAATTRELQELRSDFRAFYTSPVPEMVPVRARTMRKAPSNAAKAPARTKAPDKRKAK